MGLKCDGFISPGSPTGVYEHVLLQVLYACESDAAGWTLKGPVGAVGAWSGGWADIEVVWILDTLQPGTTTKDKMKTKSERLKDFQIRI